MAQSPRVPMQPRDSAMSTISSASSPGSHSCGHQGRLSSTATAAKRSRSFSKSSSVSSSPVPLLLTGLGFPRRLPFANQPYMLHQGRCHPFSQPN